MNASSPAQPVVCRDGETPPRPGAIAAIGNFDGVHLGHRRLIEATLALRKTAGGGPAAIVTFEPHPRDYFRPDEPSFRLTTEAGKLKILGRLGVAIVFVRRFDGALAERSASGFVRDVLARDLLLAGVVVGENFHFGRGREGTPAILAGLAAEAGMAARIEPPVTLDGEVVSSSRIRDHLAAGEIAGANRLLGYRWFVGGEVRHGDKRGRTLGYPTANVRLDPGCRLRHGIYAVRIAIASGDVRDGVASFGRRPTFDDGAPLLEVNLFGFSGDLYGRPVEVEFLGWIRGEERFDSADALVERMNADAAEAAGIVAAARDDDLDSFIG